MNPPNIVQKRAWWRGALSLPAAFGALGVASAEFWPDVPFLGPLARMVESAAPHLAVITLLLSFTIFRLGGRSFGITLMLVAVVGFGGVAQRHWSRSVPVDPAVEPVVQVLWYNMLHSNPMSPADLIAALEESPADVILLTEATPLSTQHARLRQTFATVKGCTEWRCDIMILVRDPSIQAVLRPMPSTGSDRMGVVTVHHPEHPLLTLVGVHMLKPWFYGLSAADEWMVVHMARQVDGPLAVVGDFNAAPWSKRIRDIADFCHLAATRQPVATWPAMLGRFGIPIDLILSRGGAAIQNVTAWGGRELGSNHRGLLFTIGYAPEQSTALPPGCSVPQDMRQRLRLSQASAAPA